MQRCDFHFDLPTSLIAQYPLPQRSHSRLLCLDGQSGALEDHLFSSLQEQLRPGDLLVFNDTRVLPARLFGIKQSGGKVEVLVERVQDERRALAYVRASKPPRPGARLTLTGHSQPSVSVEVLGRRDDLFELYFDDPRPLVKILNDLGHVPLPPYIARTAEHQDSERYQTVYARHQGAVAAPTAGLHFDQAMLDGLARQGVASAFVTLHVGAGTFHPVRVDTIEQHKMHAERVVVSQHVCDQVRSTHTRGGRVIAVGTTSLRALESASQNDHIEPLCSETDIFIYPGYLFKTVDALITNFHLPESTLLMLVCAFAGKDNVMAAYQHAVAQNYRFFSYGDAMFITAEERIKIPKTR